MSGVARHKLNFAFFCENLICISLLESNFWFSDIRHIIKFRVFCEINKKQMKNIFSLTILNHIYVRFVKQFSQRNAN
jgi:hypothetical protein